MPLRTVLNPTTKQITMSMTRGDSETFAVKKKLADAASAFVTGDTLYFTVKQRAKDTAKCFQKVITTFNAEGMAVISILPTDTSSLEFGEYVYDIQVTFANGDKKTLVEASPFRLNPEVTYE